MIFGLVLGVVVVVLSIVLTRWQSQRLRPSDPVRLELQLWAVSLVLAALVYVAFALREGGRGWMGTELVGLAAYSAFAIVGAPGRSRLVALGWALHAAWDVVVHADAPEGLVPPWYRWACLVFDLVAAGYLVRLPVRTKGVVSL